MSSSAPFHLPVLDGTNGPGGQLYQWFPASWPEIERHTAWRIDWGYVAVEGWPQDVRVPSVRSASVQCTPKAEFVTLVQDLMLCDLVVLGPDGEPRDAFRDHDWSAIPLNTGMLGPACIAPGRILDRFVAAEVHDDQLRWKSFDNSSRRGQALGVWSAFSINGYQYFIEYGFTCDGMIGARLGVYGPNGKEAPQVFLHCPSWSLRPHLGNPADVEVSRASWALESSGRAVVNLQPFCDGNEGAVTSDLERFDTLRFHNPKQLNTHEPPRPIGFDLLAERSGQFRCESAGAEHLRCDYLVSVDSGTAAPRSMRSAMQGLAPNPLGGKPKRVFLNTPLAHWPRSAKFQATPNVAHTQWAGFLIRPRDLFASTPCFP